MLTACRPSAPPAVTARTARTVAPRPSSRLPARSSPCPNRARRCLTVLAFQGKHRDADADGSSSDFATLAKQLTGQLASEFASNKDSVYNRLESWLVGGHGDEAEVAPRTDQTTEESNGKRLLRMAGERLGVPTNVSEAVQSVKSWLSNPAGGEASNDSRIVGMIIHRLLETYEKQAGEEFDPADESKYDRLYSIAKSVLGSSVSRTVLKRLLRAYLGL